MHCCVDLNLDRLICFNLFEDFCLFFRVFFVNDLDVCVDIPVPFGTHLPSLLGQLLDDLDLLVLDWDVKHLSKLIELSVKNVGPDILVV